MLSLGLPITSSFLLYLNE